MLRTISSHSTTSAENAPSLFHNPDSCRILTMLGQISVPQSVNRLDMLVCQMSRADLIYAFDLFKERRYVLMANPALRPITEVHGSPFMLKRPCLWQQTNVAAFVVSLLTPRILIVIDTCKSKILQLKSLLAVTGDLLLVGFPCESSVIVTQSSRR
jgi:hypothetical protein